MSLERFYSNSRGASFSLPTSISSSTHAQSTGTLEATAPDERGALGLNILHDPSQPVAAFIFVHGLGGGSRKTWSKTASAAHYWPREWLPAHTALRHVQVLSFGYDSDWVKGKDNVLNVHHFGKALLAEMTTSPYLQSEQVPIVMLGHSMGGCVIKKAYVLARQDTALCTLARRINAILFLATPHRGADLAKTLSLMLEVKSSSRAYVDDLQRCSEALQTINDEFRNYSDDLQLWSFYETQKLHIKMFSTLVVTVDSATLGYRSEKQIPMVADHRSICKFDTPEDPNYIIIRNSLTTIVKDLADTALHKEEELARNQMAILRKYLAVNGPPEEDLVVVNDARLSGTCEWLSKRKGFREWYGVTPGSPSLLWVNGKPATGKSVLAGYVIKQLHDSQAMCSYFFFKHSDKSKGQLSACLRSLAFQMACYSDQIRLALLQMQLDDVQLDKDNARMIWQNLFLGNILQKDFGGQYWVIDALDECDNTAVLFGSILPDLKNSIPLRILITSRDSPELEGRFGSLGRQTLHTESLTFDDTLCDIRLLIEAKEELLMFIEDGNRRTLIDTVVEKASGSFLWTVLVMNELTNVHSQEEVQKILNEVPKEMEPLYARALAQMAQYGRTKRLIKLILTWATCALRPLTVEELRDVLELEIKDSFPRLAESIHTLCCQLVTVDRFGKIQMIHETARQFLLDEDLKSEFAVKRVDAHSSIARICLQYLNSDEMKPPRGGRRGSTTMGGKTRRDFSNYACSMFAEHMVKADARANDILYLAERFLALNVLSWIEVVAEARDLGLLVRVSNRLKAYSNTVAAHRSPLSLQLSAIRGWVIDFVRITTKFGDALISCPTAIYSLIIPFCPTSSMIGKINNLGRQLSVVGISSSQWDDRLSCIIFQDQASTIGHGDRVFAIGLSNGGLVLYHAGSCQEFKTLHHGEAVRLIQFKPRTDLMASCGLKTVKVWNIRSGENLYSFKAPLGPITMVFDNDDLIVTSIKKYIASWNLSSPSDIIRDRPWQDSYERQSDTGLVPCALSISVGHKMLAVGYAKGPITLWDIEADKLYGTCGTETTTGETYAHRVVALVLNPNPYIDLLAVSYLDGVLVLFDPFQNMVMETFRANSFTLASSSDGQLLAADAGKGLIQIYAFDTLRMLYQVQTPNSYIKMLAFSNDNLRLIDIRGSQCNIWEPPVLLKDAVADDSSDVSTGSVMEGIASNNNIKISVVCVGPGGKAVFCGKDDGSVSAYSLSTGLFQKRLYEHKSRIRLLAFGTKHDVLISIDVSNVVSAWRMQRTGTQDSTNEQLIFQSRMECQGSISQVVVGETSERFIISTRHADYLHNLLGERESELVSSAQDASHRWIQDPRNKSQVLCIDERSLHVYSWRDWTRLASFTLTSVLTTLQLKSVRSYQSSGQLGVLLELAESDSPVKTSCLQLYDISALGTGPPALITKSVGNNENMDAVLQGAISLHRELFSAIARVVRHVLGLLGTGCLVFLDNHSWVCSVDLSVTGNALTSYLRHFFVPRDWISGMSNIACDLWQNDVVIAHNNDVVVIRRALQYYEEVSLV